MFKSRRAYTASTLELTQVIDTDMVALQQAEDPRALQQDMRVQLAALQQALTDQKEAQSTKTAFLRQQQDVRASVTSTSTKKLQKLHTAKGCARLQPGTDYAKELEQLRQEHTSLRLEMAALHQQLTIPFARNVAVECLQRSLGTQQVNHGLSSRFTDAASLGHGRAWEILNEVCMGDVDVGKGRSLDTMVAQRHEQIHALDSFSPVGSAEVLMAQVDLALALLERARHAEGKETILCVLQAYQRNHRLDFFCED